MNEPGSVYADHTVSRNRVERLVFAHRLRESLVIRPTHRARRPSNVPSTDVSRWYVCSRAHPGAGAPHGVLWRQAPTRTSPSMEPRKPSVFGLKFRPCTPGATLFTSRVPPLLSYKRSFRKKNASHGNWTEDLAKFPALLGFSPFLYACPSIDEETLYARAPRVSARTDVTNGPGERRRARTPSFACFGRLVC